MSFFMVFFLGVVIYFLVESVVWHWTLLVWCFSSI